MVHPWGFVNSHHWGFVVTLWGSVNSRWDPNCAPLGFYEFTVGPLWFGEFAVGPQLCTLGGL